MTTNYRLTDTAAKDAGGARLLMPIDDQTSQLDFGLLRGIAVEQLGSASRNLVHLAVGSHTAGSKLDKQAGMLLLVGYNESPSAMGTGNAQVARSDKLGNLYVRPASVVASISSASVETHFSGSGILESLFLRIEDANAGNTITIEDGNDYRMEFVVSSASQHLTEHFNAGLYFDSSLKHTLSLGANATASVTAWYSQN